jgi:hypothetical protein
MLSAYFRLKFVLFKLMAVASIVACLVSLIVLAFNIA